MDECCALPIEDIAVFTKDTIPEGKDIGTLSLITYYKPNAEPVFGWSFQPLLSDDHATRESSHAHTIATFPGMENLQEFPSVPPSNIPLAKSVCDPPQSKSAEGGKQSTIPSIPGPKKSLKPADSDISWSRTSSLNRHERIHSGEKAFQSGVCNAEFTRKESLTVHKRIHSGEKPFKCPECEVYVSTATQLKNHMWTHSGEKPFPCDHCSAAFATNSHLKSHKLTHTGEKPFRCDDCGAAFTRNSTLTRHKLTHSGLKPFHCDECDKAFTTNQNFQKHKEIHQRPKNSSHV